MDNKTYDHIPTQEEMLKDYQDQINMDPKNPMSDYYIRELDYPNVKWLSVTINVLIFIVVIAGLVLTLWFTTKNVLLTVLLPIGISIIYCLIRLKSVLIFMVQMYQLLAPTKIRMRCRFEPSCSTYMIMAIEKYGPYKGLIKGLKRIHRCEPPNGGIDLP